MSDLRGQEGSDGPLPWLEPAEDYEDEPGTPIVSLIAAVVVALVAIGLIVGGIFWLRNRPVSGGDGGLIAAPKEPYKVKPDSPGGMKVEGTGDVAYGASVGQDTNSTIDLNALPEAPVKGPGSEMTSTDAAAGAKVIADAAKQQKAATPPATKVAANNPLLITTVKPEPKQVPMKPATPPAATPAPASGGGGGTIQLGALASEAQANKAWASLSKRFAFLAPLGHSVMKAEVNGKTYYRLRANAGGDASGICAKLKVAGELCNVVHD